MADDKNIEIKIAATGGDQAAAEVRKVGAAAQEILDKNVNDPNGSTGFGGMLEAQEKYLTALEAQKLAIDELATSQKKALDEEIAGMKEKEAASREFLEKLNDEKDLSSQVSRRKEIAVATGAIGTAATLAYQAVKSVYDELNKIDPDQLRELDPAWAEQIESANKFKEALSNPLLALAALANGGTTVKEAIGGLNAQLALNAEATAAQIQRSFDKAAIQVEEIKKLAAELKTANDLLNRQDELAAKQRQLESAERVRNGADGDDERALLAKAAAADQIKKIEREQEQIRKDENPQAKFDAAERDRQLAAEFRADQAQKIANADAKAKRLQEEGQQIDPKTSPIEFLSKANEFGAATRERDKLAQDQTKEEFARQAEERAAASQKEFEEAQKRIKDFDADADVRKAIVRKDSDITVADAAGDKAARLKKEQDAAKEKARQKAEDDARDALKRNLSDREDGLDDTARGAAGKFTTAGGNVGGRVGSSLQDIGNKLADGTNQAEVDKVTQQLIAATQGLGGATLAGFMQVLAEMQKQAKEVAGIKKKLKLQ